uniref:LamG-like jellyroll fold domain-containing protein n=1 Tax=Solibacter usitatus (strain Ellin6076) TaxID=234267 RepID=Q01PZ1_SOLUE
MASASSGSENEVSVVACTDFAAITNQLQRILCSPGFVSAGRLRQFLDYIVTRAIEGKTGDLKEFVIGVEVLGKPDFDPKEDAAVRTLANRVRTRLEEYYQGPGAKDEVLILLPRGRYLPQFLLRASATQAGVTPRPRQWTLREKFIAAAACAATFLLGTALFRWKAHEAASGINQPRVSWGRVLAKATSEGGSPKVIQASGQFDMLLASPDEQHVYAECPWSRVLTVIATANDSVSTWTLAQDAGPLAISPDSSTLYVGSRLGGVVVIDAVSGRSKRKIVPTAGPVWDLALTPDGSSLFVAMSQFGVWRISTRNWEARQLTNQGCPESLKVSPDGSMLVVNYQCGGPGGSSGHDTVEFYDIEKGQVIGVLAGMPFVGGGASFSPDGRTVLLDGLDACSDAHYDHRNCPATPTNVFHLVRMADRRIVSSTGLPVTTAFARFIADDQARVLVGGSGLRIMDAPLRKSFEEWQPEASPGEKAHVIDAMAFLPGRRRTYVTDSTWGRILVLDAESGDCNPVPNGLIAHYPGDGVYADVVGESTLSPVGGVHFAPGHAGQAFEFDGVSGQLIMLPSGHHQFGFRDSSLVSYVKFGSLRGTMIMLDREPRRGLRVRLARSPDQRIALDWDLGGHCHLRSRTEVLANRWYQIAVTKTDQEVALYISGTREDSCPLTTGAESHWAPMSFGSAWEGTDRLQGKLDEILFYDRALTSDEVRKMYAKRESETCRM